MKLPLGPVLSPLIAASIVLGCSTTSDGLTGTGGRNSSGASGGTGAGGSTGTGGSGTGSGGSNTNGGADGAAGNTGSGGRAAGNVGSGGAGNVGGGSGGSAGSGNTGVGGAVPSGLPTVTGACPTLANGSVDVAGSRVRLWVGRIPGPVYFYFHATGTTAAEVDQALPGATSAVASAGGVVASFEMTNGRGTNTGNRVWYTGDFEAADQILACAVQAGLADTRRIHAAGYSAGGLQTGAMIFMRSRYLASAVVYSGGKGFGAAGLEDPSNVPATLFAHGAVGSDVLILDFAQLSITLGQDLVGLGGFAVDCNDGGGHVSPSRLGVSGGAMAFLAAHPFKTKPSPYAGGFPTNTFPAHCLPVR